MKDLSDPKGNPCQSVVIASFNNKHHNGLGKAIIVPIALTGALLKIPFMMSHDLKVTFCDVT